MKKLVVILLVVGMMIGPAFAHPGSTDYKGGHTDRSTGEYHYHHGYSAHDHVDGVCPYDFDDRTGENSGSSSAISSTTESKSVNHGPQDSFIAKAGDVILWILRGSFAIVAFGWPLGIFAWLGVSSIIEVVKKRKTKR